VIVDCSLICDLGIFDWEVTSRSGSGDWHDAAGTEPRQIDNRQSTITNESTIEDQRSLNV
jgi:hypothetical protein